MVRFVFRSLNPYSRLIAEELKEIEIRAPLSETIFLHIRYSYLRFNPWIENLIYEGQSKITES